MTVFVQIVRKAAAEHRCCTAAGGITTLVEYFHAKRQAFDHFAHQHHAA